MAKKKKTQSETEVVEKPAAKKLKSINKREKKEAKQNKVKSKNKLVDCVISQLKGKKNAKTANGDVKSKDKENIVKSNKPLDDVASKQNSNQNDAAGKKKKNRKKNKKNKGSAEKPEANGVSDQQLSSVQENGEAKKGKKRKNKKKKKKDEAKETNVFIVDLKKDDQKSDKGGKKNKNKLLKRLNIKKLSNILKEADTKEVKVDTVKPVEKRAPSPLSLRDRMMAQLKASRFRFLNEQMYNSDSMSSKKFFQNDPQAFYAYHEGYKHQVERWPLNPLDVIIDSIKNMPKDHVVADFGCGEARLADSVPQTVHSFDLVAVNEKVKACDMANTPLLTGRANVVVFCLSLMGSNLADYLLEANRVLQQNGILKVAEVESRFDKIDDFIATLSKYGFVNTWKDLSHNLFYFMDFKKTKDVLKKDVKKLPEVTLKPCLYKKR